MKRLLAAAALGAQACAPGAPVATPAPPKAPKVAGPARFQLPPALPEPVPAEPGRAVSWPHVKQPEPPKLATRSPDVAAPRSKTTTIPPRTRGNREAAVPSAGVNAHLVKIRQCESGGNYQAVSPSGHMGAYQFDAATHRSVGGDGNAADDTPAQQDAAAMRLYAARGGQPWACA